MCVCGGGFSYHHAASDDGVRSTERQLCISDVDSGFPGSVGLDVTQVSSVPLLIARTAVFLPGRVEVGACTHTACKKKNTSIWLVAHIKRLFFYQRNSRQTDGYGSRGHLLSAQSPFQ